MSALCDDESIAVIDSHIGPVVPDRDSSSHDWLWRRLDHQAGEPWATLGIDPPKGARSRREVRDCHE